MNTPTAKLALLLVFTFVSFITLSQDAPDKIWVTFQSTNDVPLSIDGKLKSSNRSVQSLVENYSIVSVEQVVPTSSKESLQRLYEVRCNCVRDELLKEIENYPTVFSEPTPAPVYSLLNDPDDYNLTFQSDYALDLINANDAWQYSMGDASTVIGISDANYYVAHEELEGKIAFVEPMSAGGNFYHGTAVAITAAGATDNGKGKSSIGYNCKLSLTTIDYNKILQMSQNGVRVINISWTSGCFPISYVQSIVDEVYENGTILVAAAGNGNTCGGPTNPVFPASCDNVLSVTSVGPNDNHQKIPGNPFSTHQHNSTVDLCAPGYDVALSIFPEYYSYGTGSSFAAPLVSGTIGLMLSIRPCLTNEEILEILRLSADDIYPFNPTYVDQLGWGRLNAGKALELTELYGCTGSIGSTDSTNPNILTVTNSGNGINANEPDPTPNSPLNEHFDDKVESNITSEIASIPELAELEIEVYPNPTSGPAMLEWDIDDVMELSIVDARGVIVRSQQLLPHMKKTQIDLVESGVYFLRITRGNKQEWMGKLVKL